MNHMSKKYGLFTAITMIVGICIGSGIFFKSDDILASTGGSIGMGVILFIVAALAIIFGCLSISELASRTDQVGGVISYAETFYNKPVACAFGWFQTFVYFPSITAVVAWVIGVYTCILFKLGDSLLLQIGIGYAFLCLCFLYNVFFPKFGAFFQNSTTVIKMIPLFLLGVLGFVFGDPIAGLTQMNPNTVAGVGFLTALGPIAFSFDGWIVSTAISHELKDAKRNTPRALLLGPVIVLCIYVLYFTGITSYVGSEQVMNLGDAHVSFAAEKLLGVWFSKAIVIFVIISVMGTVNGLVTGFIRMPFALAVRGKMFPASQYFSKLNKQDMPIYSAVLAWAIASLYTVLHYFLFQQGSDISEGAIVIAYLFYILLYFKVFQMYLKKEITSVFRGVICPFFATLGSLVILSGGIQSKFFIWYVLFCVALSFGAAFYYKTRK